MKHLLSSLFSLITLISFSQNFQWAKGFSSFYNVTPYQVLVDNQNNIYEIGRFNGNADFDPGPNVFMLASGAPTSGNVGSIYVSKQDSNGNFLWAKTLGAQGSISPTELKPAMCLDEAGNIYIAGLFFQTVDFNPDAGTNTLFSSDEAYFITKWNTNGVYQWATQFCSGAGPATADPLAITYFGGNIYVAGSFESSANFELFTNVYPTNPNYITANGYRDIFVTSINANGTQLNWVKTFGNPSDTNYFDRVSELTADNSGNLILTGTFNGTFDANPGTAVSTITAPLNQATPFLVKLNSSGNYVAAKSFVNASSIQMSFSSPQNTLVIGGQFNSTLDVGISGSSLITSPNSDGYNTFFCSYNGSLGLNWVKTIDGDVEALGGIAIDLDGNTYVTGLHSAGTDLDVNGDVYLDPVMGASTQFYDCYLIKVDYFGGTSWIQTFDYAYPVYPIFRRLISMPSGNILGFGLAAELSADLNLSPTAENNLEGLSADQPYGSFKVVYDRCPIITDLPEISGPNTATPSQTITLDLSTISPDLYVDWFAPDGWEIISATSNSVTVLCGNTSGAVLCVINDLCGNSLPLNYYITIEDPNNPSTGTYSFRLVEDINTISFDNIGSDPSNFVNFNGATYFIADVGSQLWKTDGTEAGTIDVLSNTDLVVDRIIGVFQNKLVLVAFQQSSGEEIWLSDGTSLGTSQLTEIIPGAGYPSFNRFALGDNYMYFIANDGVNGSEWWVSDGTITGTYMVAALSPSSYFDISGGPVFLGDAIAFGGIANNNDRKDLWIIGPAQGQATNLTAQFPASFLTGLNVSSIVKFNNLLFFDFYPGNDGVELFASDGTVAGTFMFELYPGNESSYPEGLVVMGNKLLFQAYTPSYPQGCLVVMDDNFMLSEIAVNGFGLSSNVQNAGIMYFSGTDGLQGYELWRTDGTESGTWQIADIMPGAGSSSPGNFAWCGSKLYFTANAGTLSQPFVSNGTEAGTFMLADLFNNGIVGSFAHDFTYLNGNTFFIARTAFIDFHVFKTDGTIDGTEIIYAEGATNFSNPAGEGTVVVESSGALYLVNDKIFLSADYHNISRELYVIDSGEDVVNVIATNDGFEGTIKMFPNPSSDFVTVECSNEMIECLELIDLTGKSVLKISPNTEKYTLAISDIASGIYTLCVTTSVGKDEHKLIKK